MSFDYRNLPRSGLPSIHSLEEEQESSKKVGEREELGKKTTEIGLNTFKSFSEEQTPKTLVGKISFCQMFDEFDSDIEEKVETKMQGWQKWSTEEKKGVVRELLIGNAVFGEELPLSERKKELGSKEENYPGLSQLLEDPQLFSITEIKTGTLEEGSSSRKKISDSIASLQEQGIKILKQKGENIPFEKLVSEREFRAINLSDVYEAVISAREQQVVSQQFPETKAWYIGALSEGNPLNSFQKELLTIGSTHKIIVISDGKVEEIERSKNFLYFENELPVPWPRDAWDFSQGSEVRIPYYFKTDLEEVENFLKGKREERGWGRENLSIETIGRSLMRSSNDKAVDLASALDALPILNLTYNEEGNTIFGVNSFNEPFLLIGKDSYEISKESLKQTLGQEVTDDDLKKAFGIDYGIEAKNIFFVEQPACFHLDMRMCTLNGNKIALNDSVKSLEKWKSVTIEEISGEDYDKLYQEALRFKNLEDKTEKDLTEQGFDVVRVGGHFLRDTDLDCEGFNFFNLLTATTPDEKKIIVSLGFFHPSLEESFKEMLNDGGVAYDALYFLDPQLSGLSLFFDGGIKCRTKSIS